MSLVGLKVVLFLEEVCEIEESYELVVLADCYC